MGSGVEGAIGADKCPCTNGNGAGVKEGCREVDEDASSYAEVCTVVYCNRPEDIWFVFKELLVFFWGCGDGWERVGIANDSASALDESSTREQRCKPMPKLNHLPPIRIIPRCIETSASKHTSLSSRSEAGSEGEVELAAEHPGRVLSLVEALHLLWKDGW